MFTTQLLSRVVLFLITGVARRRLIVFGAIVVAYRSRPVFVPTDEVDPLAPYRIAISGRPKLITIGLSADLRAGLRALRAGQLGDRPAVAATAPASARPTRSSATTSGFYVFDLPMYELVLGWLFVDHRDRASSSC